VRALVPGQVNQLGCLAGPADGCFLNGFPLANQRDYAAVVIGIHFPVKQIDPWDSHGFDNGVDFGRIAAFGEIGHAFNKSVGHGIKDKECGSIRQLG
jgi:hypothetical protein